MSHPTYFSPDRSGSSGAGGCAPMNHNSPTTEQSETASESHNTDKEKENKEEKSALRRFMSEPVLPSSAKVCSMQLHADSAA